MRRRLRRSLVALVPSLVVAALFAPAVASASSWSIRETAALPNTEGGGTFQSVSCTSSESCTALGGYKNATGFSRPLAGHWNGTEWSPQEVPLSAGTIAAELSGASCPSSEACIGVGHYVNSSHAELSLAERWNGKNGPSRKLKYRPERKAVA